MTTFDANSNQQRARRTGIRIACVYRNRQRVEFKLANMADLRFYRMAEALARRGHDVDIVINLRSAPTLREPGLREIPFSWVRWHEYDPATATVPARPRFTSSHAILPTAP